MNFLHVWTSLLCLRSEPAIIAPPIRSTQVWSESPLFEDHILDHAVPAPVPWRLSAVEEDEMEPLRDEAIAGVTADVCTGYFLTGRLW